MDTSERALKNGVNPETVPAFSETIATHNIVLSRKKTGTLQINTGYLCNQTCKHCHLSAGPDRKENMDRQTVEEILTYASRWQFDTIDITGGAPELNPNLPYLISEISGMAHKVIFRSNLTAFNELKDRSLLNLLVGNKIVVVASMPSINESQTDAQRGIGIFNRSIDSLKELNRMGYGMSGSGLELNLVSNPAGAYMPSPQEQTEKRFRKIFEQKWGIYFNNLFTFANMPLGRFKKWLIKTGNYDLYLQKLYSAFNPSTIEELMCRTLISVSWDGFLYDCDFNLAEGLHKGNEKIHVSEANGPPLPGEEIAVGYHCYACTAGCGFT